jgi:hypothetical protein
VALHRGDGQRLALGDLRGPGDGRPGRIGGGQRVPHHHVLFKKVPVEVSVEYRPTFGIVNTRQMDWVNFGAHAHVYLK